MSRSARSIRPAALLSLALAAVLASGCSPADDAADTVGASDTAAPAPAPAPAPAAPAPSDAQIAHIAVTANSIDSAAGVMARPMASAKEVKDFAQAMVTDHGAVNKQAVGLATKLGVTPEDNETSRGLKASADAAMATLHAQSGAAFDKAYIANEVTYHQTVLDALDKTLIPNAQNGELKALLVKVRPNIAAHLAHAKSVQAKLP